VARSMHSKMCCIRSSACGAGLSPWGAALDAQWPWPYALESLKDAEYEPTYPGAEVTRRKAWKLYSPWRHICARPEAKN
jgi:hypothetical protein